MNRGKKITKVCEHCKQEFEALAIKIRAGGGKYCSRSCYNDSRKSSDQRKKYLNRISQKKHKYGLNEQEYLLLFEAAKNKCQICNISFEKTSACVDHCHTTTKVRGLLCNSCNKGLGHFQDDSELLKKAIYYLGK